MNKLSQCPRYIMVGGFLGAGKTTTIARLGRYLHDRGFRIGLITNDQANGLVDTAMLRSLGFETEEIAGGCFCCRFSSLTAAAEKLTASSQPDIFIAEPVGSCTDLVATVSYPLRRIYGSQFELAPLSVLVDPVRARRLFGLENPARRFSPKVEYIYQKQLQEAHAIVINKCDSLPPGQLTELTSLIHEQFPDKKIFHISARHSGAETEAWMEWVLSTTMEIQPTMAIDYDIYAEGEALLGWLNASIKISSADLWDSSSWLLRICRNLIRAADEIDSEIAHLKMTLSPVDGLGDEVAVINAVRNDIVPELSQSIDEPIHEAELILNMRAEADPADLKYLVERELTAMQTAFSSTPMKVSIEHLECFRPGRPVPEFRDSVGEKM